MQHAPISTHHTLFRSDSLSNENPLQNHFLSTSSPKDTYLKSKSSLKKVKSWPSLMRPVTKNVRFNATDLKQICMFKFQETPKDIVKSPKFYIKDYGDDLSIHSLEQQARLQVLQSNIPPFPCPFSISGKRIQVESCSYHNGLLMGSILVKNLAFEKQVSVRFTLNTWKSFSEIQAYYHQTKVFHGETVDQFLFNLSIEDILSWPETCFEFAVRYQVGDHVYWDNYDNLNYHVVLGTPAESPVLNSTYVYPNLHALQLESQCMKQFEFPNSKFV